MSLIILRGGGGDYYTNGNTHRDEPVENAAVDSRSV
jgi:hypothetical protein